ncbi:MAG TPA: M13 family metallopeptidase [Thermoanaerobaculia bacterium]|jgi:putative endopeptidase|nr:M13 family metallopeptidase [Thermoanaerobaculia bacterium]
MRRLFIAAVIVLTALAISCGSSHTIGSSATAAAPAPAFFAPHGFDLSAMDTSVKACDDFYRFAVGKWRETHPLPAQYSRYGRFEELAERNREVLHKILEEDAAMTNAAPGSAEQKVGDFYASCMNETAIETAGVTPIQPELDRINAISDRASLVSELIHLHTAGYGPLFRIGGTNDQKNSKMIIASLGTGALGLPDRDYYLRDDDRFKTIRNQYIDHVSKMLVLSGEGADQANSDAKRILDLETKLAASQLTRVEQRVPENTYHPTAVTELASMAPAVDWPTYLQNLGVSTTTINVSQPKYIQTVSQLMNDVPLEDWKALLRWQVVDSAAPTLSSAFVTEDFNFGGKTLSGTKEQQERWKRCVRSADASIGQLLGQEYVRRNFTPEAKAKMSSLIDNLVGALREDIPTLSWMGPETKAAALTKLNAFQRRIGYPDKWRDYSALPISRASYAANIQAARAWAYHHNIERIGHPDDPNEWGFFTPPTVNASYSPNQNNITFPAGILQPPFFDPNADDAYNYGGIGTVIGHEMTHGFDDQGAKYDAQGNLRNWFTPEDLKNFQARTDCVANEYSEFNVAQGININGKLVNGESVADLGGATIALRAYEKSLEGKQRQTIDGFTPEQRFFLGFAQVWGENMSPQEATRRALTDPHAQGPFRVNGTVQNMPEFWKAYHCTDGDKMVREASKRCSIW